MTRNLEEGNLHKIPAFLSNVKQQIALRLQKLVLRVSNSRAFQVNDLVVSQIADFWVVKPPEKRFFKQNFLNSFQGRK